MLLTFLPQPLQPRLHFTFPDPQNTLSGFTREPGLAAHCLMLEAFSNIGASLYDPVTFAFCMSAKPCGWCCYILLPLIPQIERPLCAFVAQPWKTPP